MAQLPILESKVYTWDKCNAVIKKASGMEKLIFNGNGGKLSLHSMKGIILYKGKKLNYPSDNNGPERFFIIKKGPVSVQLSGIEYTIDKGSVIVLLPGDALTILNSNNTNAELYEMTYHSIAAPDAERGRKAGTSFVMNWNDMVFKPHDKGGVRQLFDRSTTMLNRFDIHVTQLNKGFKSHEPHTHANEEIILMLEGNAEMQIGNEHQKANPGDVVLLNSMVLHNLTNIGTTPCLYFAIQWN
ncbi:cupin domain-containing protein [Asinibacterium sp. OR53]|nr:cupin domain-containing protein [Asinibacterium sp. OR53]